ncbi:hypothetical protein SKAU_G00336270 [Synaphobranchus kaupii]|uniref:Uncharacterized protein n=1 Tax=Synaphobranchus kaupii TaxID=118154 RepID=A0A9Q1EM39_SYNKA|nr:hypothetical protein SKAU_G00336270 [Synaphobranchus kaupii]
MDVLRPPCRGWVEEALKECARAAKPVRAGSLLSALSVPASPQVAPLERGAAIAEAVAPLSIVCPDRDPVWSYLFCFPERFSLSAQT